jgi:hypothetical protein
MHAGHAASWLSLQCLMSAHCEKLRCAAAPLEARAHDADRAALAGTGLEGLFDPAPTGDCKPPTSRLIILDT